MSDKSGYNQNLSNSDSSSSGNSSSSLKIEESEGNNKTPYISENSKSSTSQDVNNQNKSSIDKVTISQHHKIIQQVNSCFPTLLDTLVFSFNIFSLF